jgi:DMSO/TMAO reductase YedYZ molybdopterin-dependent catalytic subunit
MSEKDNDILADKVREFESGKKEHSANTALILNEKRELSASMTETEARKQVAMRSRRGFLVGGAAALIGVFGWRWMPDETKAALLRRTFEFNERVSQIFYRPTRLAPEFPPDQITAARFNGDAGLKTELDTASWRLRISGVAGRADDLMVTLDDIKRLPRTEMTTEFKCIEGWSTIVHWAGVRFSDLLAKYPPKTNNGSEPDIVNRPHELLPYVSMTTPDEEYYVGWDMPSILHPQTLLAYEMNGEPLKPEHGAPLRLASPTKYGIKQIKRIGRIEFTNERPRDFWAEPQYGYDWYAGH